MKLLSILSIFFALLLITGCSKPATSTTGTATEQQVLTDFAGVLVNPNYQDIQAKAGIMNQAIITLNASRTATNLTAVQTAWRNTRTAWESCEGFLFGPVEDNNYDPMTDTWPMDKVELDSLLASNNALQVADIDALPFSLKGYHAIEYVIFGVGGTRVVDSISPRMWTYLVSMGQSVYNTTTALRNSWDPAQNNFTAQLVNAGNGSTRFLTRKAAFLAIVASMSDICNEVGNEKMQNPLGMVVGSADSTQDESSFSHNSTADFTNNITGVRNAYLCQYNGSATGHSMHQLVAANNLALDNKITSELNTAISAIIAIGPNYEVAIYTQSQRQLIQTAQAAIATLKNTLDDDLTNYITVYIND